MQSPCGTAPAHLQAFCCLVTVVPAPASESEGSQQKTCLRSSAFTSLSLLNFFSLRMSRISWVPYDLENCACAAKPLTGPATVLDAVFLEAARHDKHAVPLRFERLRGQ